MSVCIVTYLIAMGYLILLVSVILRTPTHRKASRRFEKAAAIMLIVGYLSFSIVHLVEAVSESPRVQEFLNAYVAELLTYSLYIT